MSVNHEDKLVENVSNLMACDSFNDVRIRFSNGVHVDANKQGDVGLGYQIFLLDLLVYPLASNR